MEDNSFVSNFVKLTGYVPFIWQSRLFHDYFLKGNLPSALDIPTGLGKTSVIALWYLALKQRPDLPRRIVYVVDRRAVVDQATTVAENIKTKSGDEDLNVSTLRGKLLDNRNWLSNPAVPTIIVGTIDMIGSRLLFSGYGVSRKMRSYHAGLLGTDTLIVLDESHLVPAFEKLLQTIERGTNTKEANTFGPLSDAEQNIIRPLRLLSLSATGKYDNLEESTEIFQLSNDDKNDCYVKKRLLAYKRLIIQEFYDSKKCLFELLAEQAWNISVQNGPSRIIVYCDLRDDAVKVKREIDKKIRSEYGNQNRKPMSELLVGGRRILEREKIAIWLKDTGFIDGIGEVLEHSVFLMATAAGEVGIDLDADHMVCDLVEWERIVQRLGRVNRRGIKESNIYVVVAPRKNLKQDDLHRLRKPLDLLRSFKSNNGHDASPDSILDLKTRATVDSKIRRLLIQAGKTITLQPALTRALLDAWSFTSLKNHIGRPSNIQPWLRGWEDNQKLTATVVWRKYLPVHANLSNKEVEEFFEAAAPHISETLETETYRVCEWLKNSARTRFQNEQTLSARDTSQSSTDDQIQPLCKQDIIAYILSPTRELVKMKIKGKNCVEIRGSDLENKEFVAKLKEEYLPNSMLVLDARFGGLSDDGMLVASEKKIPQVVDDGSEWITDQNGIPIVRCRVKMTSDDDTIEFESGWYERIRFELNKSEDEETKEWLVVEKMLDDAETEDDRSTAPFQELDEHQAWTERKARCIAASLSLPENYVNVLAISARLHDEGKRLNRWQQAFNAPKDNKVYAKTKGPINIRLLDNYRHEFGSLSYVEQNLDFQMLNEDLQDLVLHLVVSHHGWGRPVVSTHGCDEPPSSLEQRAYDVTLRFERLQNQWGPWGLAWWEALLRSADQQASIENCER